MRSFLVAFALSAALGCTGTDRLAPGEPIGTFHVTSTLTSTTCGPVPNPWEFDIRLRFADTTLYWVQGGAPVSGTVSASRVELRAKDVVTVRPPDQRSRSNGCAIQREDVVSMTLARADQTPASNLAETEAFTGTLRYTFQPTETSDCMDQLSHAGGDFENLPCDVIYEIAGSKK